MNKIIIATTAAALISPAIAGDYMVGGDNNSVSNGGYAVAATSSEPGTLRKVLSTPGRVLSVGDQLPPMLSEGTQEFGISGNLNFADDFAYNLDLSYGWFLKDNWEIGFQASVQGVESDMNIGLGLFTEYNFSNDDSKWVPFIGMSAEWAKLDSDAFEADSIALGLEVGIKYFIRENIALSFSIGAQYAFDDVFPGGDDFQEQINIGTRFYF